MMPWDISMRKALSEVLSGINQMLLSGYAPHDYSPEHILSDAKSYLTDYKELANDSAEFAEWKENSPLTWEELKGMEGEPVWIVDDEGDEYWVLIIRFSYSKQLQVECMFVFMAYGAGIGTFRNNGSWQAYRKKKTNVSEVY